MKPHENLSLTDIPGEVWKEIKGFEGIYQISSLGRVKAIRFKNRIRVPHISKDGYAKITLCVNNKYSYFNVHRLVAMTFLPKIGQPESFEVDHIDGDKLNNSIDNLRWVTHGDNMRNPATTATLKNRKGPFLGSFGKKHPASKPIYAINDEGHRLDFDGCRDADRKGYNFSAVQNCLHNKRESYLGYRWFYKTSSQNTGIPIETHLI